MFKGIQHGGEVGGFLSHFGLEYRGQSLATCTELVLQQLLKQKRRHPNLWERARCYRRQDGKSGHCTGELCIESEEFDHLVPVRDAVHGQDIQWGASCKPCHAILTDREAAREKPPAEPV